MESCIKVINSGSNGNCLAIYDSRGKYVLIDLGVKYGFIIKGVNYNLQDCVAAFVSHIHSDHSIAIDECLKRGINIYANEDVRSKYDACKPMPRTLVFNENGFRVRTFAVEHNVPNNAFIIDTIDGILVLYITDAKKIPYRIKNVNYAIVECNHDEEYIIQNEIDGVENRSKYYNHLSLGKCIDYLKNIYNEKMRGILLWHTSTTNLDGLYAIKKVQTELGFNNVEVAVPSVVMETEKELF